MENGTKVVVTTSSRGVFFGELVARDVERVTLRNARNCLYWHASVRGFVGLSVTGPLEGSRVGPACEEIELTGVTSIARASDDAIKAWEAGPWSG